MERQVVPESEAREYKALCVGAFGTWADVPLADLAVSVISGGLSNRNYLVTRTTTPALGDGDGPGGGGPREVMLRVFGEGSLDLVDRDGEAVGAWKTTRPSPAGSAGRVDPS